MSIAQRKGSGLIGGPLMFGAAGKLTLCRVEQVHSGALHFGVAAQNEQKRFQHRLLLADGEQHLRGLLEGSQISRAEFGRWHG